MSFMVEPRSAAEAAALQVEAAGPDGEGGKPSAKPGSDRRVLWLSLALVCLGVLHRGFLFWSHLPDLRALVAANPGWVTWQFLSQQGLSQDLGQSLLYLQQSPPLPNALFGMVSRIFGWPFGAAYALVLLQALLSITASLLLYRAILDRCERWVWGGFGVAALFLLSTDLVVMEYNSFGQTFYENFCMVPVLLMVLAAERLRRSGSVRYSWTIGICTGLLALVRAAYSLVALPSLLVVLLLAPRQKLRHAACVLAAVLVLQGSWVAKNFLVYRTVSPNTSTWSGGNFAVGLVRYGYGEEFLRFLKSEPERHPEWFNRLMNEKGLALWHTPHIADYVPAPVRVADWQISARLHGVNPPSNSIGQRLLFDEYLSAYARFARARPKLVLRKFLDSYRLFWQPIRNYGMQYVSLFATRLVILDVLNLRSTLSSLRHGALPEAQYVMKGTFPNHHYDPARLYTPDVAAPLVLMANFLGVHFIAPLVLVLGWFQRKSADNSRKQTLLLLLALLVWYAYAGLIFNLAEFGENTRFRVSVEPLIWLISLTAFMELGRSLLPASRRRAAGLSS